MGLKLQLSRWVDLQRCAPAYSTSLAVADQPNRCQVSQPSCKQHIPAQSLPYFSSNG